MPVGIPELLDLLCSAPFVSPFRSCRRLTAPAVGECALQDGRHFNDASVAQARSVGRLQPLKFYSPDQCSICSYQSISLPVKGPRTNFLFVVVCCCLCAVKEFSLRPMPMAREMAHIINANVHTCSPGYLLTPTGVWSSQDSSG